MKYSQLLLSIYYYNSKWELLKVTEYREESEIEVQDSTVVDKLAKFTIALSDKGKDDPDLAKIRESIVLPEGMTIDTIRSWVPRVIESLSKVNPYERMDGRDDKHYRAPLNYANIESNMQERDIDVG